MNNTVTTVLDRRRSEATAIAPGAGRGRIWSKTAFLASCATLCVAASPAFAQTGGKLGADRTTASPQDLETHDQGQSGTEVIIVTAQKRAQDIIQVPLALSAFTSSTLEAAQVRQFDDLTRLSPSLNINGSGNVNQQVVALRGIGSSSFSISSEPSTLVVVDNVALLQPGQAFGSLSDIARVEVLRGPQGTLFGKSASAGVINIVTEGPTKRLSGYVEGTLTTDGEHRVASMLSGPIGENAGFRLNGYYVHRAGYLNNLTTGDRLNAEKGYGVRGKFKYASGAFSANLIADYSKDNANSGASTYLFFPAGTTDASDNVVDLTGIKPGPANNNLRQDGLQANNTKQLLLSSDLNYDLGFAELTSISSYQNWKFFSASDGDQLPDPVIYQFGPYDARQFAQEFRLTSPSGTPFEYQVGLYYANAKTDRAFTRTVPSFLSFLKQNWNSTATSKSYAAFGQLAYNFGPLTKLTLGGRLNREDIGVVFADHKRTPGTTYTGSSGDTAATWKVSLQHSVQHDVMVYGTVSTGYKGAAYDVSSGFTQARADNPVRPERSTAFEIGIKGRTRNGLASFSLDGFWSNYNNFQAQGVSNPGALVPNFQLVNVGKLRSRGIEFEGTLHPTKGLSVHGSAAYIDATIRSYPDAQCYAGQTAVQGCVNGLQNLAGGVLPNSPKFKFNVGTNYEAAVTDRYTGFVNANYVWQSKTQYGLSEDPLSVQPSYGIANLNIGLRSTGNRNTSLMLFVNNLFNKAYASDLQTDTNYSVPVVFQQLPRNFRRYFGAVLRVGL